MLLKSSSVATSFLEKNQDRLESVEIDEAAIKTLMEKARKEDEIEEIELVENRGEVLKPCLYKRR